MQIFQTIWTAMTTPNDIALSIVGFLSCFPEAIVNMLLFTTVLNITTTRKSRISYVISISLIAILTRLFVPDPYGTFINMIVIIFLIKFILKSSFLKALLAEFMVIVLITIL